jgi:integrase
MATIKFYLQSTKSEAGIYVRLRQGKDIDAKAKTKFIINPSDWSQSKQQPKNDKDEQFKKLNSDLSDFKNRLLAHYNKSVLNTKIDSNWLKEFINPSEDILSGTPTKIVDYFKYYASIKKPSVDSGTYTKYFTNKKFVELFQKSKKTEYYIKDFNEDFVADFEIFCKQNNIAQNTFQRKVSSIKTICLHARKNGVETHYQLDSIVAKKEDVDIVYLFEEEYDKICNENFEFDYLNNVRDWLIVCVESAQRISDFMNFTKNKIRFDGEDSFIDFKQHKTKKQMSIYITPKLSELLLKNEGNFPRKISNAKFNKYIKKAAQLCGLTEPCKGALKDKETKIRKVGYFPKYQLISSKIGRKTFATYYFGKLPNELIMAQTGHTTESSFLLYVGKPQISLSKQLATAIKQLNKDKNTQKDETI